MQMQILSFIPYTGDLNGRQYTCRIPSDWQKLTEKLPTKNVTNFLVRPIV